MNIFGKEQSSAVKEFLANGGVIRKVKTKKVPKNVNRTSRGLMGPSKQTGTTTA